MGAKLALNRLRQKKVLTINGVRFWSKSPGEALCGGKGDVSGSEWGVAVI